METVESFVQPIDPNLLAIAIVIMMVAFIIMMIFYIPRIEKVKKLEKELASYKKAKHSAEEKLTYELVRNDEDKIVLINRKRQADQKAEKMAKEYDKLRNIYGL